MTEPLMDAADRERGLTDFQHNLVVTAGAGTGKTSLLVGRLLTALVKLHLEPRQVLALTFTENAAAEMLERLTRLLRAVEPFVRGEPLEEPSDRHTLEAIGLGQEFVSRAADVLSQIEQVPISTFHSYCLKFLQSRARRLGLPPDLDLGDGGDVSASFAHAFLEFLKNAEPGGVRRILERFDVSELRALAESMLTVPADSLERLGRLKKPDALNQLHEQLAALAARYPKGLPKWRAAVDVLMAATLELDAAEFEHPRDFQSELTLPRSTPGLGGTEKDKAVRTEVEAILTGAIAALRPFFDDQEAHIDLAVEFVRPFVEDFRAARRERGELTFDDLLLMTREFLLRDGELRMEAGSDLRAILVDEFQDTDPLQYDVVFALAAQPTPGPIVDPMEVALRDNVLFIVGDAKQSIYRFRRADIAAFGRATDRVLEQGGAHLNLSSNFRCTAPVLDLVNRICAETLAEHRPFQFGYADVVPTREATRTTTTEILIPEGGDDLNAAERRDLEGRLVVQTLDQLQRDGIEFGNIAVLMQSMTETSWLLRPLRAANIPFVVEGSRRFYARQEVVLATALITAMTRPHDPVAVLALLRSAWSDATDRDIHSFLGPRDSRNALDFRVPPTGKGPVQRTLSLLQELRTEISDLPLDVALTRLLRHETWTISEGVGFEGAQRLANLERLLDRLLRERYIDLLEVCDALGRHTREETEDEESPLFDRNVQAVRILTIHGAKGLEFGAVIVPDLARPQHSSPQRAAAHVQRLFDSEGRELVGVKIGKNCANAAEHVIADNRRQHDRAESRRLFYVAATRARDYLGLICAAESKRNPLWQDDLIAALGLDLAEPARATAIQTVKPRPVEAAIEPATVVAAWLHEEARRGTNRSPDDETRVRPSQGHAHRQTRAEHSKTELPLFRSPAADPIDFAPEEPKPRAAPGRAKELGIALHGYLAAVDASSSVPEVDLLRKLEVHGNFAPTDLAELVARFHASDLRRRWAAARSAHRELPIAYRDSTGRSVVGAIDLLLELDSGWCIIDYKTDRVLGDGHTAAAERYRAQLVRYGEGVRQAFGLDDPPTLEVWFARDDVSVTIVSTNRV